MAGFRIGDKTTAILGAVASLITFILGGAVGRKTAPTTTVQPADTRPIVNVPPVNVTISPDLVPAVLDAVKARKESERKKNDQLTQAERDLASAQARVDQLKGAPKASDK